MKYAWIINVLNWIKGNVLLTFVLIGFGTACTILLLREKAKVKCEDCTIYKEQSKTYAEQSKYYMEQNKQLLGALIHVEKVENGSIPTSFNLTENDFAMFASNDTTPKQRMINRYIDSVVRQMKRQDSIMKSKTKN